MSDTTTTLNPGASGDVMDEELVLQSDGVTQAKAPRVVIRGPAQNAVVSPVAADPGKNPYSVPALGTALVDDAVPGNYVCGELRPISMTTDGRLRVSMVPAAIDVDFFGCAAPNYFGSVTFAVAGNPWSM